MAGIIREQDLTLPEYFELHMNRGECTGLYETNFDNNPATYRHSLFTICALGKLKPQARQLLELISFLDPDVIGGDLLMKFNTANYLQAQHDLLKPPLIQMDGKKMQISVHRIVQDGIPATRENDYCSTKLYNFWAE